jgi:O-acetyl-ADP-ribose deacetylase (regulator of RNase III)
MINYVVGDATQPEGQGPKLIIHVCNDAGLWGAGFVLAISRRWPLPELVYREWAVQANPQDPPFSLGEVGFVRAAQDVYVANMVAQHNVGERDGVPAIRYDALRACLKKVAAWCVSMDASVHAPRFGCGLAGGTWPEVEALIVDELTARGIEVTVYELDETVAYFNGL